MIVSGWGVLDWHQGVREQTFVLQICSACALLLTMGCGSSERHTQPRGRSGQEQSNPTANPDANPSCQADVSIEVVRIKQVRDNVEVEVRIQSAGPRSTISISRYGLAYIALPGMSLQSKVLGKIVVRRPTTYKARAIAPPDPGKSPWDEVLITREPHTLAVTLTDFELVEVSTGHRIDGAALDYELRGDFAMAVDAKSGWLTNVSVYGRGRVVFDAQ